MSSSPWTLANRAARMNPSIIREILKVTEKPGILSMAGGLPSADTFPVEQLKAACERVLTDNPREALQYAASEGFAPLREWAAARVKRDIGIEASPDQVLITSGSQQGLDLVGKILCDTGAPVAVETPTYLGALQAFTPYEPQFTSLDSDGEGPLPEAIRALNTNAPGTRFMYLLPNFQNPTGRVMSNARRDAVMEAARAVGVPVVEDNPYGDLWFDEPPLPSLTSRWAEGSIYLGSFSKILTPGFRLGFCIAPKALYPKLLQAKQAADLHTPGFNQRVVYEVIKDGFLDQHIPTIRERYKANRDAMADALREHLPEGCEWSSPKGGMFFWIRLPEGLNAMALLPTAVEANIAFVPGAAFYARDPDPRALRLSFVTLTPDRIREGVAILGKVLNDALNGSHAPHALMSSGIERAGRRYELRFDALDVDAVHAMLSRAYWCVGIPRETVAKAMANSLCASLFCEGRQIGIARWVSDRATFAYLCDVYVHEDHRGLGLGDWLVGEGLKHPDLQGLRRQVLFTKDMHPLYRKHGFAELATPERGMEIVRPNLYSQGPHAPLPAA